MLKGVQGWLEEVGRRLVFVFVRFISEEVIKLAYAVGRDGIGFQVGERQVCSLDDTYEVVLGFSYFVRGVLEDEYGFGGSVDKFLGFSQYTEYVGMGYYAEGGFVVYIG